MPRDNDPDPDAPLASSMQDEYQRIGASLRNHVGAFLAHMTRVVQSDPESLAKPEALHLLAEVAVAAYHLEHGAANMDRRIETECRKLERGWD